MLESLEMIKAFRGGDESVCRTHPWLFMLVSAEERIVNLERISSIGELAHANPVLDYVERTLTILDSLPLSYWIKELLEEVLAWAETAKGGTVRYGSGSIGPNPASICSSTISDRPSCTNGMSWSAGGA